MYLSQLVLDHRSRDVLMDLADPYQLHRRVMKAFPVPLPAGERVLYRLEQQRRMPYLTVLVQSHTLPDWSELDERGYLLLPAATKPVEICPVRGQMFRFRLLANPTKRVKADGKTDGPRVGLRREEEQLAWLERKAASNGFCVLEAQAVKTLQPEGVKRDRGETHHIHCDGVRFDGLLRVLDPACFLAGLTSGIGSGKGFGFGLLSLAPVSS